MQPGTSAAEESVLATTHSGREERRGFRWHQKRGLGKEVDNVARASL